jgi:hypothetical protein
MIASSAVCRVVSKESNSVVKKGWRGESGSRSKPACDHRAAITVTVHSRFSGEEVDDTVPIVLQKPW